MWRCIPSSRSHEASACLFPTELCRASERKISVRVVCLCKTVAGNREAQCAVARTLSLQQPVCVSNLRERVLSRCCSATRPPTSRRTRAWWCTWGSRAWSCSSSCSTSSSPSSSRGQSLAHCLRLSRWGPASVVSVCVVPKCGFRVQGPAALPTLPLCRRA
eukprot:3667644-Rhodomonas_salina.1